MASGGDQRAASQAVEEGGRCPPSSRGHVTSPLPLVVATLARERGVTGVHTHVRQLRRYCESAGVPVELVTSHSWASGGLWRRLLLVFLFGARIVLERTCGPLHVLWYRSSHEFFLRHALHKALAQRGPCTVYAQCPVSARAALTARAGPHQRVVVGVHFRISQADEWADKDQISRGGWVYCWIRETERQVLPRVDGLVFVSSWAHAAVKSWMPAVDEVPGTVVHNFVSAPSTGDATARRAGSLVTVGALEPVKNHRYLLRVLAAARQKGFVYSLDVFGEGVERASLAALSDELGVSDQVRLLGFCSDVQRRLPEYQAYVHASYSESSSLAIMEAMAMGLPVVSSAACALAELFEDPTHGRFWPIDDVEGAARVLIGLMESPDALERAGHAAREKFLRDYDARVVAPRLLQFLSQRAAQPG